MKQANRSKGRPSVFDFRPTAQAAYSQPACVPRWPLPKRMGARPSGACSGTDTRTSRSANNGGKRPSARWHRKHSVFERFRCGQSGRQRFPGVAPLTHKVDRHHSGRCRGGGGICFQPFGARWKSGRESGDSNPDRQSQHHDRAPLMKRILLTICLTGALACGQPAIAPPRVGFIQDSNHSFRPVLGLAGNFVLEASLRDDVTSSASLAPSD